MAVPGYLAPEPGDAECFDGWFDTLALRVRVENFACCLRDAAMLTRAFRLGDIYGWSMAWNDLENGRQETDEWRPGCGWTAGSKLTKGGSP